VNSVDFAKSEPIYPDNISFMSAILTATLTAGIPAEMEAKLKPDRWPDFMGKGEHMSYQCDNVLGKLFRIVSLVRLPSIWR
jgi:hypothetical protein